MAQRGVKLLAELGLGLGLAACSTASPPPAPAAAPPAVSHPAPAQTPLASTPPPTSRPAPSTDQCGAAPLQWLVGKPRTDIPVPIEPNRRRVVCATCEVTPENVPFRQTIVYDLNTGLVTQVKCG